MTSGPDSAIIKSVRALSNREPEFQIVRAIIEGREAKQFDNEQLSKVTGIVAADLNHLEDGTANPTLSTLKRLAEGLVMTLRLDFQPRA